MTTIPYTLDDTTYQLQIEIDEYRHGGTALTFIDVTDPSNPEPFQTATTWLDVIMPEYSYLDVNNFPDIVDLFEDLNLGEPVGPVRTSGFVTYPLYHLNMDEINKYVFNP